MDKRELKYYAVALLVVVLAVAAGLVISDQADARTKRTGDGCISAAEYRAAQRDTMHNLEHQLGVAGAGTIVKTQQHGRHVLKQYRWCGHPVSEGYFQVFYSRNKAGAYMSQYVTWFQYPSCGGVKCLARSESR